MHSMGNAIMDRQTRSQDKPISHRSLSAHIEVPRRRRATALDLSGLGLTQWPEALGPLTALQMLNLADNQLTALPEAFRHLESLQRLYLRRKSIDRGQAP
jgi:Leucine-rich repeat (LRR) protein